jgi:hypothetical protein
MPRLDYSFRELRHATDVIEGAIAKEKIEYSVRRQAQTEVPSMVYDAIEEWKTAWALPAILRRSQFISIYSLVEHWLNMHCDEARREKKIPIRYTDLKDKGIERAKSYLLKLAEIAFPSKSEEWQRLKDHGRLRNCLAHNNGRVENNEEGQAIRALAAKVGWSTAVSGSSVSSTNSGTPMTHSRDGAIAATAFAIAWTSDWSTSSSMKNSNRCRG